MENAAGVVTVSLPLPPSHLMSTSSTRMSLVQKSCNTLMDSAEHAKLDMFQRASPCSRTLAIRAFVGGSSWCSRGTFLDFADVRRFLQYYLRCNIFRLGSACIQQVRGVPNGGGASAICAAVVLGGCEATWRENESMRDAHGFGESPEDFDVYTTGAGTLTMQSLPAPDTAKNALKIWLITLMGTH